VTANNAITELLSAPLGPDWTVERLAEQVLGAVAAAPCAEESQEFILDADTTTDRQSDRLLRPLIAYLANKSATEAGAPTNLYGGRFSIKRPGPNGTVWILGEFENRPGRVRVAMRRASSPTEGHPNTPAEDTSKHDDCAVGRESKFDVFLCHNTVDKPAVKNIGTQLMAKGLRPWLDEWNLRPGFPWQKELDTQIKNIRAAAVFVGANSIGPWQVHEIDAFLRECVKRQIPVIPVILPDCQQPPDLPVFLGAMTWVDFRKSEPDPIGQMLFGIRGYRSNAMGKLMSTGAKSETGAVPRSPIKGSTPQGQQVPHHADAIHSSEAEKIEIPSSDNGPTWAIVIIVIAMIIIIALAKMKGDTDGKKIQPLAPPVVNNVNKLEMFTMISHPQAVRNKKEGVITLTVYYSLPHIKKGTWLRIEVAEDEAFTKKWGTKNGGDSQSFLVEHLEGKDSYQPVDLENRKIDMGWVRIAVCGEPDWRLDSKPFVVE
jgi:hypothetical protein